MYSMTGYGKAEYSEGGIDLTVELKTVNNRYLDVNCKYPRLFVSFEDRIRKIIQSKLSRGRVDLFITYNDSRDVKKDLKIDFPLARAYMKAVGSLKAEFSELKDDFTITTLLRTPDVVSLNAEDENEKLGEILEQTLNTALDNLNAMRLTEGKKLIEDMTSRMKTIEKYYAKIKEIAPSVAESYRQKLKERVEEYLKDAKIDETRFLNEVAFFTDKSNIDEELTRLSSHISQFYKIVSAYNSGRKLDFLIQELNREVNTICSKSNNLDITNCGLELKCEIEKIREQAQNIE